LEAVSFVVDENLLRLGRALALLRRDVVLVGEDPVADLLPRGVLDSEWIPMVGDRGWIMITNDRRPRTRPVEAELCVKHNLKVINLHGRVGNQAPWDQAVRLLSRWEGIAQQIAAKPDGPWWLSVQPTQVRVLRYEPGGIERI